jgi:hypothetical protein
MTFAKKISLVVFFTSVLFSETVRAQEIEIKGLRLGMTKQEVQKKIGRLPVDNFTIAGVQSKYGEFSPEFYHGKLDSFTFFFDSSDFDQVLSAVKDKYPALICENTTITNAMGARFTQTVCNLRDKLGVLHLSRYLMSNITSSVLSLNSDRYLKDFTDKQNKLKKDL